MHKILIDRLLLNVQGAIL